MRGGSRQRSGGGTSRRPSELADAASGPCTGTDRNQASSPAAGDAGTTPRPVVDNLTAGISPSAIFLRTVNSETDSISATAATVR